MEEEKLQEEKIESVQGADLAITYTFKNPPLALYFVVFLSTHMSLPFLTHLSFFLSVSPVSLPGGWVSWPRVKVSYTHSTPVHSALGKSVCMRREVKEGSELLLGAVQ